MKKFLLITIAILVAFPVFCQEENLQKLENLENNTQSKSENESKKDKVYRVEQDTVIIEVGDEIFSVKEMGEQTRIKIGKKQFRVVQDNDGVVVFKSSDKESNKKNYERFKGHWAGVELGFNNYMTSDKSLVLPADIEYMTLSSSNSINFNINFSQLSLGLTRHIGFVTGLGLNFNNYKFDGNNNIQKGTNGIIEILDPGSSLEKSKLATIYLNLPFFLEIQIPVNNNHLNIAAGPIGAVKIGSHTKMVFQDGPKVKASGDFSLNMLRYGATARAGYGNFQVYGTYYRIPLFQKGKSPDGYDLFPFEIGCAFTFND